MKKIFKLNLILCAVFIVSSIQTNAQSNSNSANHVQFGIQTGIQFQNINGSDANNNKLSNDLLIAFNAGLTLTFPIAPEFFVQSGLYYSLKGATGEEIDFGVVMKRNIKINYIELPIHLLYKPMLGNGHLILGIGPYLALGISGKVKFEGGGASLTQTIKFKNSVSLTDPGNYSYFRPLDAGADLIAGYEFSNNISFQLDAQLGLLKINPKYEFANDSKTSAKNTGFGLTIGYHF
ncbi:MAG: PorT family protein [Saprospiraceae bacterium]|uniref:PorT family protein n=1 Tax=Candidatus Defluviibacterium haderslevense TaxID=2981993 RepID=A0A9D7S8X9_9BACT|nr:PorT family protein [Candidatus Defluviibacterium haderslevense]MBL0237124.1 PorT family protein [Candidatus Defluviibacterium haderslevense]